MTNAAANPPKQGRAPESKNSPSSASDQGWIRRLAGACWRHPTVVVLAFAASIIGVSMQAASPLLVKSAVDDAVGGSAGRLGVIISALIGLQLLTFAGAFARRYLGGRLALDVQHDLRKAIFDSVSRFDGGKQDALRTGQIASRAITDLQLVTSILMQIPLSAGTIIFALLALVAMLWMSPLLTLIALVITPAVAIVIGLSRRKLFPATWSAQQRAANLAQHVEETVTGVRVVKGFGQEAREIDQLERSARTLFAERLRSANLSAVPTATTSALPAAGQVAVLAAGGILALNGSVSIGTFLAFATYVSWLIGPARMLSSLVVQAQLTRAGAERVYELIDAQPDVREADNAQGVPDAPLELRLNDVRFGYSRSEPVLNGLTLHARPGETLALVGTAGSGKSTISLLLPRFYDVHDGSVLIGPHDGLVDVRDLRLAELRSSIGVVFEEPFLFSSSVRDNIAYGRPDASDSEVIAAAKATEAHEFINELPDGYDTLVGERGLTLSGGQRQRLGLARALLTNPRILVLDDATSAVDTVTEAAIHGTLREVTAQRTTLLIAHRRSTLALADRIAVLDQGRVVDIGTEQQLRERCALFRDLTSGQGQDLEHAGCGSDDSADERDSSGVTARLWTTRHAEDSTRSALPAGQLVGSHEPQPNMPATPEVLDRLGSLPPATATPRLPGVEASAPDPGFRFRRILHPVRWLLAVVIGLVATDTLASIALPSLYQHGVDDGVRVGVESTIWLVAGIGAAIIVVDWIAVAMQTKLTARAGETVLYLLRVRSYAHLQRLGLDYYERELSGKIMTRMTTDVDALSTFLQTGVANAIVSALTIVGIAIALLVTDPALAAFALAVLPILAVATIIFRKFSSAAYTEARERVSIVNADMQEYVNGLRIAQAYTREAYSAEVFAERSQAYRHSRLRAQRYIATYFPFATMLSGVAQAIVLAAGAHRVATGTLSPGVLLAFVLYIGLFFSPVQQLSSVFDGYQQAKVGLRRIGDLLRTPTSVPATKDPYPIPARLRGEVTLNSVGFSYPGTGTRALDNVSLSVNEGETVALVGATGAGKSTVVKLIARFYDAGSGSVLIDGIDVRDYNLSELRARMGIVPQEAHLFSGTVADNVRYGRPSASDAEVESAVRSIGAIEGIYAMPLGFHQPVGERGRALSAGQRQLVALARAELVDPDVLLLDEATAALDPATETAVLHATESLTHRRTTFVVAHRLATAARADRIIMLDHGRIIEQGTHERLIDNAGHYARLWAAGEDVG